MEHQSLYQSKPKSYYASFREELLPFVPSQVRNALDVGCGQGNFGKALKEHMNCTVWGVEPDNKSALDANQKLDRVLNASFDKNLDFGDQKFDCVFFNDVLEHLIDPHSALGLARALLLPGGYVISSLPNILHFPVIWKILVERDWKYEDIGVLDQTHLRFFTKKSMERMFVECGFEIISIKGINSRFGRKFSLVNFLSLNKLEEMKYVQFATVARVPK